MSFEDNEYENLNHHAEIDFDYTDMNLQRVFDIFRMKFKSSDLQKVGF